MDVSGKTIPKLIFFPAGCRSCSHWRRHGLELYHLEQMPAVCNAKGLEFETIDRAASRSFCGPCGMACWQGFRPCGQPAAVGR